MVRPSPSSYSFNFFVFKRTRSCREKYCGFSCCRRDETKVFFFFTLQVFLGFLFVIDQVTLLRLVRRTDAIDTFTQAHSRLVLLSIVFFGICFMELENPGLVLDLDIQMYGLCM
jgi:hypothetical protein